MALVLRFLPILLVIAVLLLIFRRSSAAKTPAQEGSGKLFLSLGATLVGFVLFVAGAELITRL